MDFNPSYYTRRVHIQDFTGSASLGGGDGISVYCVTNSSGGTVGMTLPSFHPVGFIYEVLKEDNTPGMTLSIGGGITLAGDTGTFGASATSVKRMRVIKVSATKVVIEQSGS